MVVIPVFKFQKADLMSCSFNPLFFYTKVLTVYHLQDWEKNIDCYFSITVFFKSIYVNVWWWKIYIGPIQFIIKIFVVRQSFGMVFLIHFAYTTLKRNTWSIYYLRFWCWYTLSLFWTHFGKGMNWPPRVGLYLSKLNFILSICVRTNPLSDISNTSAWCSMSVAIWFKTFVISSSLVISYLLLLTSLLTTFVGFLALEVAESL